MGILRRLGGWFVDRLGLAGVWEVFGRHPVPPGTTRRWMGWLYALGITTLGVLVLQVVTGAALATKYIPSTAHAYDSLRYITEDAWFGRLVRGTHFFGASAMVVFIGLHMVRVFLTGSYKFPREMNWLTGVPLLVLTIAMAFTGQLLRWNQDGLWGVVVASQYAGRVPFIGEALKQFILAGDTVGGVTLSRFFAFHVIWMPLAILALVGVHLYLVVHHGVSEPADADTPPVDPATYRERYRAIVARGGKRYWPDAAWQEVVLAVAVIAGVVALGGLIGPRELGAPPDPTVVPASPKPDWYLIWYYALLWFKPSWLETLVMVYLPLAALAALVLLPLVAGRGERRLQRRPWAVGVVLFGFVIFGTLTVQGYRAPWVPAFDTVPLVPATARTDPDPVTRGARVFYDRGCQYCHRVLGRGGDYGPDLTAVHTRLPPGAVRIRIINGIGNMPAYRDILTTEELDAIVAFLESLEGRVQ